MKKSSRCVKKCIFFDKTTRFLWKLQKKMFSIEISENNAHTLPFQFTWSVKTTQKLFRSFSTQNKRYYELLSVFDLHFQFEMKPPNSPLFSWDDMALSSVSGLMELIFEINLGQYNIFPNVKSQIVLLSYSIFHEFLAWGHKVFIGKL